MYADDDNDIELALFVAKAYLPGITSNSLQDVVTSNPTHFYLAKNRGMAATEEILEHLLTHMSDHT